MKARRKKKLEAGNIIAMSAQVDVHAAADEASAPRFAVNAYNGGPLTVAGFSLPVVVELSSLQMSPSVTANLDHDSGQRVGHVTAANNDGNSLTLEGEVSAVSSAADEVVQSANRGYPWQASIEAQPGKLETISAGKSRQVNGQTIEGPAYVAKNSKLYGFAFLSRGADESTSATIAAAATEKEPIAMKEEVRTFIEAQGFDPDDMNEEQVASMEQLLVATTAKKAPTFSSVDDVLAKQKEDEEREAQYATVIAANINADNRETLTELAAAARKSKQDPRDFELTVLRASRPSGHFGIHSQKKAKVDDRMLEAALCLSGGLQNIDTQFSDQELEAARKQFPSGAGLRDLFVTAARSRGYNGNDIKITKNISNYAFGFASNGTMIEAAQGWSYINIAGILSNVANKYLANGFNSVERVYPVVSATQTAQDYKQLNGYALTADMTYQKVGPGGEIKHGTLGEVPYANKVDDYARMVALTNQDLVNDDLSALTQVTTKLGRGGALALNRIFWTEFMDNSTFYTVGRNNLITNVLDRDGLNAAEVAFRKQKDPDGDLLGAMPRILLTGPSLANTAGELMGSQLRVAAGASGANITTTPDINIFRGRYTDISSAYLEDTTIAGNSATQWFLLADPMDLPVQAIAYLNGQQQPMVESADASFNTLGVQMRGTHAFGVAKMEYRGGVKSTGAG